MSVKFVNASGNDVTSPVIEMPNSEMLIGISTNTRYLKFTPTVEGGELSDEQITSIELATDNSSVMSVSSSGKPSVKAKAKGTAHITVTAQNSQSGHTATTTLTFNVVEAADLIDVVTGTSESQGSMLTIKGKLLGSVSFKLKDAYKDIMKIVSSGGGSVSDSDVTYSQQNGTVTVTNTSLGDLFPQKDFAIKDTDEEKQFGSVFALFELDDNESYQLDSATMKVVSTYGNGKTDGEMMALDLSTWEGNRINSVFTINPGVLRDATNVVTEVTSSDDSVVVVESNNVSVLNNDRMIPIQILSAGTTDLTLHITDGVGYNETAIITVVVTA